MHHRGSQRQLVGSKQTHWETQPPVGVLANRHDQQAHNIHRATGNPASHACHLMPAVQDVIQDGKWKWQGLTPAELELETPCHFCSFHNYIWVEQSFLPRSLIACVWSPWFPDVKVRHLFYTSVPGNCMVSLTCSSENESNRFSFSIAPYFFSLK